VKRRAHLTDADDASAAHASSPADGLVLGALPIVRALGRHDLGGIAAVCGVPTVCASIDRDAAVVHARGHLLTADVARDAIRVSLAATRLELVVATSGEEDRECDDRGAHS
jgi:hypothetical protein